MSELVGLGAFDAGAVRVLVARLAFDLSMTGLVLHGIYLRLYRERAHVVTCYLFNAVTLCLCILLRRGPAQLGFALTLFGVFGILRYRTEQIPSRDLTYLFVVIGLGIINGVAGTQVGVIEVAIVNVVVVGLTALLELRSHGRAEHAVSMCYDRLDLLCPGRETELAADVSTRTGLTVVRVETERFDLLRDAAEVRVFARTRSPAS